MANPCSPNASEPKTGIGPILVYDAAKLANFLINQGMGWLSPFVPQIGGQNYDLTAFCVSDPPDAPTTDASTIANFFNPLNPTGASDLRMWLFDVVNYFVWYASCQCSTGPQPTAPSPIDQPPDVDLQPPESDAQPGCWNESVSRTPNYSNGVSWNFNDIMPGPASTHTDGEFFHNIVPTPIPQSITLSFTVNADGSNNRSAEYFLSFFNSSGGSISGGYSSAVLSPGDPTDVHNVPVPSTAAEWTLVASAISGSGTATNTISMGVTVYCQGQSPTAIDMVCCPTDPNLLSMLNEILNQIQFLQAIIPIRPVAYVARDTTTGLSGSGTYSVADSSVIALKVVVTTLPAYVGQVSGVPDTYFGLGYVTPVNAGGPEQGTPITRSTQVFPLPEATTALDYSLTPGAVISITELLSG
jgi:hypothetical protein